MSDLNHLMMKENKKEIKNEVRNSTEESIAFLALVDTIFDEYEEVYKRLAK